MNFYTVAGINGGSIDAFNAGEVGDLRSGDDGAGRLKSVGGIFGGVEGKFEGKKGVGKGSGGGNLEKADRSGATGGEDSKKQRENR